MWNRAHIPFMPELPEVETVCRGMERALGNRKIAAADVRRGGLRVPFPKKLGDILAGRRIVRYGRRAKYILLHLDNSQVIVVHLGMSGRVTLIDDIHAYKPQKHDHLIVKFEKNTAFAFNDPRRFGMLLAVKESDLDAHPAFKTLGPEPLSNDFSGPVLFSALKKRKTTMKAALMDQKVVAGLGNIYVCEALYYAGISPFRLACDVKPAEAEKLAVAIRDVLNRAIEKGGSSLRDYRQADGELGYFQHEFAVYGREGEKCPQCLCAKHKSCGIERAVQSGRSTFWCRHRQK